MFNPFMHMALEQGEIAFQKGEVPVGAVIVKDNKVIAKAYNLRETENCAVSHAEIIAIKNACEALGTWRLDDCSIYVTLEPCIMCTGAILNARLKNVYYGSYDKNNAALEMVIHHLKPSVTPSVYGGIMENECNQLLEKFFNSIRK